MRLLLLSSVCCLVGSACAQEAEKPEMPAGPPVVWQPAFPAQAGFDRPLFVAFTATDPDMAYVVVQPGQVFRIPRDGSKADRSTVQWGEIGSVLVTRALVENNLLDVIMKPEVFCPIPWWDWQLLLADDPRPARSLVTGDSYSIHLWQEMWRRAGAIDSVVIPPGSLFGQLLEHFGVAW